MKNEREEKRREEKRREEKRRKEKRREEKRREEKRREEKRREEVLFSERQPCFFEEFRWFVSEEPLREEGCLFQEKNRSEKNGSFLKNRSLFSSVLLFKKDVF